MHEPLLLKGAPGSPYTRKMLAILRYRHIPASCSKNSHRYSASLRALQEWERGCKNPSGAARTLLKIAGSNPKALLAVADD